jgi:DNA gyrase/topoisomerase IV subunit A
MEPEDKRDVPEHDALPDVRDGLTRLERVILHVLGEARAEFGERHVPTALLYGRVVEYVDVSVQEFQRVLARLAGR